MAPRPTHRAWVALLVAGSLVGVGAGSGTADVGQASKVKVSVQVRGTQGVVISVPRGVSCPSYCSAEFTRGSDVALYAGSGPRSGLAGWKGACVGAASSCLLAPEGNTSVTATFQRRTIGIGGSLKTRHFLYVTIFGEGRVRSSPPGIDCPNACSKSFKKGESVTLEAVPSRRGQQAFLDGLFATCTGNSCRLRMTSNADLTATFRRAR